MGDERDSQRQHVLKAGTILFDGSGTDCLVRKISLGGANLEVESQTGIPDSFLHDRHLSTSLGTFQVSTTSFTERMQNPRIHILA